MLEVSVQIFYIFLATGVLLVGAELFVPGGVVGAAGAMCLLVAIVMGFKAYPEHGGLIAIGILCLGMVSVIAWMNVFPRTKYGQKLMISRELSDSKGAEDGLDELVGKHGIACSPLRPGGYADIEGRRVDVITRGEMLDKDQPIYVVEVEGNRVVVAELSEQNNEKDTV